MRTFDARELNFLIEHGIDPFSLPQDISEVIPVEYIAGIAVFMGRDFIVNSSVLIPRIETEGLARLASEFIAGRALGVLDMATGSGVVGTTLKLMAPAISLTLSDISQPALEITQQNLAKHNLLNVEVVQSALWEKFDGRKFDVVVANLPYIPSDRIPQLDATVKDFEPTLALDGGKDGLLLIKKFLKGLPSQLKEGGRAFLEVDDTHGQVVADEMLSELDLRLQITVEHDFNTRPRYWVVS